MRNKENVLFDKLKSLDPYLLIPTVLLTIYGIVVISSASGYIGGGNNLVTVQIIASTLGFFGMIFLSVFNYDRFLKRFVIPVFIAACILLILPIAEDIPSMLHGSFGNNDIWIAIPYIGVNLQPSEVVKALFILTFGYHLGILREKNINTPKSLFLMCAHGGIIMLCVMLEKDLGAMISFGIIFVGMCFCAGVSIWYLIGALGALVVAFPIIWRFLDEYQKMRILVGFDPMQDPEGYGYQVIQSMRAIANGGVTGMGYKGGTISQNPIESILPARHTDMIFAVMCEEFGFIGAIVYFILIIALVFRILIIARRNRENYGIYMCAGVACVFIFQTIENIGMCLGLLPVIGITLPFMSYGGSSIVSLYMCVGIVMSVSIHQNDISSKRIIKLK
ncbi:MAG: rod shape-determining protein RodA [Clostridia bacterium]|nr:rod shape-determining protein RodA [Clostridia bacterium]